MFAVTNRTRHMTRGPALSELGVRLGLAEHEALLGHAATALAHFRLILVAETGQHIFVFCNVV